jgi:hypothetical protein
MKPSLNIDDVLAKLRQEHRSIEAPASLEAHLKEQTLRARATRPAPHIWIWAGGLSLAMAAACVAGIVSWRLNHPVTPPAPATHAGPPIAMSEPPQAVAAPFADASSAETAHPAAVVSKHAKRVRDNFSSEDFLPLPSSEGLPAPSEASLVRMQIHSDALRQYGLEVPPTSAPRTILAEFIVGEDGLPRSIRILR